MQLEIIPLFTLKKVQRNVGLTPCHPVSPYISEEVLAEKVMRFSQEKNVKIIKYFLKKNWIDNKAYSGENHQSDMFAVDLVDLSLELYIYYEN